MARFYGWIPSIVDLDADLHIINTYPYPSEVYPRSDGDDASDSIDYCKIKGVAGSGGCEIRTLEGSSSEYIHISIERGFLVFETDVDDPFKIQAIFRCALSAYHIDQTHPLQTGSPCFKANSLTDAINKTAR